MRQFAIASFLAPLALATFAHAAILTTNVPVGTYTGTTPAMPNGMGSTGGAGYTLGTGSYQIAGGTFAGGTGGVGKSYTQVDIIDMGDGMIERYYTNVDGVGGQGGSGLYLKGTTLATITGGTFAGGTGGASAPATGATGSRGLSLEMQDGAKAIVSGGTLDGAISVTNDAKLTLVGTFSLPGGSVLQAGSGTFTGTLANSTVSQTFAWNASWGASISLTAVPEPTSLAALAGVAVVALRRRR